jgi:hypothetical protein
MRQSRFHSSLYVFVGAHFAVISEKTSYPRSLVGISPLDQDHPKLVPQLRVSSVINSPGLDHFDSGRSLTIVSVILASYFLDLLWP